jgi:hypothetical protein
MRRRELLSHSLITTGHVGTAALGCPNSCRVPHPTRVSLGGDLLFPNKIASSFRRWRFDTASLKFLPPFLPLRFPDLLWCMRNKYRLFRRRLWPLHWRLCRHRLIHHHRTVHNHWPLNYPWRGTGMRIFVVRLTALLPCLSRRQIAIAPALFLPVLPSRRIFSGKWIMVPAMLAVPVTLAFMLITPVLTFPLVFVMLSAAMLVPMLIMIASPCGDHQSQAKQSY